MLSDTTDHRTRVGQDKRARMRARLIAVIMRLRSEAGGNDNFVIDDVVKAADVSRGTFYKYFVSIEEALNIIGRQLADEMVMELMPVCDVLADPIDRVATGLQVFQWRAVFDPVWGRFVSRTDYLFVDPELLSAIFIDLERGRSAGLFDFSSTKIASDFAIGATLGGLRRAVDGDTSEARIFELSRMILIGLGVDRITACARTREAYAHLVDHAPGRLPWWYESARTSLQYQSSP